MRDCWVCTKSFEPRTRMHYYCGMECWEADGGRDLRDVEGLDHRHCIQCDKLFEPINRLQRYCGPECYNESGETAMQRYLLCYIDDVGRLAATKDECLKVALSQGHAPIMFHWWWAEWTYYSIDDRLRLEDLPS